MEIKNLTPEVFELLMSFIYSVIDDKIYRLIHLKREPGEEFENQNTINVLSHVFANAYAIVNLAIDTFKDKEKKQLTKLNHDHLDLSVKLLIKILHY